MEDRVSNEELWEKTRSKDLSTSAEALMELGERASSREDFEEAKGLFGAALDSFIEMDVIDSIGRAHYSLGYCYYRMDEHQDAVKSLSAALAIAREVNNTSSIAYSAGPLADCLNELNKKEEAIEAYALAVDAFEELENYFPAGINALALGELHGQTGKQTKALEAFVRAYNIFQKGGDANGAARAKDRMASALIELGDYDQALAHLRDAFHTFEFIEEFERAAHTKYRIGWTLNLDEKYFEAEAPLRDSIRFFRSEKMWSRAALAELQLCDSLIFRDVRQTNKEAEKLLVRIHSFFESAGEQANLLIAQSLNASRYLELGDFAKSIEMFERILEEALVLEDSFLVRSIRLNLVEAHTQAGNVAAAAALLGGLDEGQFGENGPEKKRLKDAAAKLQELVSNPSSQ